MLFVPVIGKDRKPLMPTSPWRAARWIKSGKATPYWSNGIFCVRLNQEPSDTKTQQVVVGIDPGSKREAFTIKSRAHTYLNVLVNAVTWVKDAVEQRRNLRRSRRQRKTPYRKARENRTHGGLPPSTKARWQLKLRVVNRLRRIFHIADFVVEDIKAETKKGQPRWNVSFSPLEVGKKWFYDELRKLGDLHLMRGYETFELRNAHGLKKSSAKLKDTFDAHNVDSWVLANSLISGHNCPDNVDFVRWVPLELHRRMLHRAKSDKNGMRKRYGGTMSLSLKRGSLVKNDGLGGSLRDKMGLYFVGGNSNGNISLHSLINGKRLSQRIQIAETRFLAYSSFRYY